MERVLRSRMQAFLPNIISLPDAYEPENWNLTEPNRTVTMLNYGKSPFLMCLPHYKWSCLMENHHF